jgi:hypothetical protein
MRRGEGAGLFEAIKLSRVFTDFYCPVFSRRL